MANFSHTLGRRHIFFSNHALDRWWDRCKDNYVIGRKEATELLKERLGDASWSHTIPFWSRLSWWHHARAEGFLALDKESGFVVNKNPGGDRVAVTYIERIRERNS